MHTGEPVRGILHSTDAHSGVEIPLYIRGSDTVRVLAANEYLQIDSVELVTAAGGDSYVFLGTSGTLGTGQTVVRGTFAANGGMSESRVYRAGEAGEKPYVVAPAGVVDVVLTGSIMVSNTPASRPTWKEDLTKKTNS